MPARRRRPSVGSTRRLLENLIDNQKLNAEDRFFNAEMRQMAPEFYRC
jgi:hypothetical protein